MPAKMVYNAYRIRNYMQGDAMYQNIIFDLGGVVVDYAPREFLVDYFMNEKLEDQLVTSHSAAKSGNSWTPG